jgi:restriction system protein
VLGYRRGWLDSRVNNMDKEFDNSAALVAQWKQLAHERFVAAVGSGIVAAVGSASGSSHIAAVGALDVTFGLVGVEATGHVGELMVTRDEVAADIVEMRPPEVVIGFSLVETSERSDEGHIIRAVTPAWRRILTELASDPNALQRLDWRQMEEMIAGAYKEDAWHVTLTPRSGDRGRDIIAFRDDVGAIRVLDQVKQYAPDHVVPAGDVREIFGVLTLDQKASKAVITTTSTFAPGVYEEFAQVMPTRLYLRDGKQLHDWLNRIFSRT